MNDVSIPPLNIIHSVSNVFLETIFLSLSAYSRHVLNIIVIFYILETNIIRRSVMKILLALRVIPIGTGDTSLSNYVAEVVKIFEKRGLRYILSPFNTSIEIDDFSQLSDILKEIVQTLSSRDVKRIAIDMSIDVRLDKEISLGYKIESVERKIMKSSQHTSL